MSVHKLELHVNTSASYEIQVSTTAIGTLQFIAYREPGDLACSNRKTRSIERKPGPQYLQQDSQDAKKLSAHVRFMELREQKMRMFMTTEQRIPHPVTTKNCPMQVN